MIGLVSRGLHPDMVLLDLLLVFYSNFLCQSTFRTHNNVQMSPFHYNMFTHGVYWSYEVIVDIREFLKRLDWGEILVHLYIPVQHSDMPPFPVHMRSISKLNTHL